MDRLRSPAISKAFMASSSPKTPVSSGVRSTLFWLMRSTAKPNSSWKRKVPRISISLATTMFCGIEIALIGSISTELVGGISDVNYAIGTEPKRLFQNRGHDIGRDDFPGAVETRRHDRQRADRTAPRHENPFAEQGSGTVDGMQDDREGFCKGGLVDRDAIGDLVALPGFGNEALAKR